MSVLHSPKKRFREELNVQPDKNSQDKGVSRFVICKALTLSRRHWVRESSQYGPGWQISLLCFVECLIGKHINNVGHVRISNMPSHVTRKAEYYLDRVSGADACCGKGAPIVFQGFPLESYATRPNTDRSPNRCAIRCTFPWSQVHNEKRYTRRTRFRPGFDS